MEQAKEYTVYYLGWQDFPNDYLVRTGYGWSLVRSYTPFGMARFQVGDGWEGCDLPDHVRRSVEELTNKYMAGLTTGV